MADVSTFYTQRASAAPLSGEGPVTGTPGANGALGNFLDLLLASVLTGEQQNTQPETSLTKAPPATPDPIYTSVADVLEQKPEELLSSALPTPSLLSSALILPVQQPVVQTAEATAPVASELVSGLPQIPAFPSTPVLLGDSLIPEDISSVPPLPFAPQTKPDMPFTLTDVAEETLSNPVFPEVADVSDDLAPTPELAAKLNALTVGGAHKEQQADSRPMPFFQQGLTDDGSAPLVAGYQGILGGGETGYTPVLHTDKAPILPAPVSQQKIDESDALATLDLSSLSSDRLIGLGNAAAHVGANAVKHSDAAAKTSPLSTVALHLTQMASTQETRSMTVQLNPPELGRIQVKLNYGRDKTVKADIAVEKSDTLNLLQKDSDTLRQALTDAGLQADAGALNFSLAHDGTFMGDTGNGGEGNVPNTGGGEAIGDDLAVFDIKTREVWTVDPKTGDVHYDILT